MHIHVHLSLVIFKKMKHFTSIFSFTKPSSYYYAQPFQRETKWQPEVSVDWLTFRSEGGAALVLFTLQSLPHV